MNNLLRLPWIFIGKWAAARYSAADSILKLTRASAAGYELWLIPSPGWLEFQRLDRSCGWFHRVADSSSSGWTRVVANFILRLFRVPAARCELQLIPSCGWLRVAADSIMRLTEHLPAGFNLRLTYTLIYPVNLRTYSAKYIIFIVCFLSADFIYHWFRLWLLLEEVKKLEEAWRSFKTLAATDSSCSGWFKLRRLIRELRPSDYLQNFDPNLPW